MNLRFAHIKSFFTYLDLPVGALIISAAILYLLAAFYGVATPEEWSCFEAIVVPLWAAGAIVITIIAVAAARGRINSMKSSLGVILLLIATTLTVRNHLDEIFAASMILNGKCNRAGAYCELYRGSGVDTHDAVEMEFIIGKKPGDRSLEAVAATLQINAVGIVKYHELPGDYFCLWRNVG